MPVGIDELDVCKLSEIPPETSVAVVFISNDSKGMLRDSDVYKLSENDLDDFKQWLNLRPSYTPRYPEFNEFGRWINK